MAYDEQEKELMAALQTLVAGFGNYDPPRLRKDGDIVIPLDAILKKNREANRSFADAFSEMMRDDLGPKRSLNMGEISNRNHPLINRQK